MIKIETIIQGLVELDQEIRLRHKEPVTRLGVVESSMELYSDRDEVKGRDGNYAWLSTHKVSGDLNAPGRLGRRPRR